MQARRRTKTFIFGLHFITLKLKYLYMKRKYHKFLVVTICCVYCTITTNANPNASLQNKTVGAWTIQYNSSNKSVNFLRNNKLVLSEVVVKAKADGSDIVSSDYTDVSFSTTTITDELGKAEKYTIEYMMTGKPTIKQIFYLYNANNFFITEVMLSDPKKVRTNYIAPIYTTAKNSFLPQDENNRLLTIPYDNDGFITYGAFPLKTDSISFEVTSIFNGESQNGLVVGSVDHTVWKSAIRMKSSNNESIDYLECYSGVTHQVTRDEVSWDEVIGKDVDGKEIKETHRHMMPHGSLRDNEVRSSRFLVGFFDDWRVGLETYGEVNEKIAPKMEWEKGVPFGWNSWGGMATHVNYEGVISVSDFMKEHLQENSFSNDNTVYVGLDSYWDNMNDYELQKFADHCYANGQIPGIYWTPFADWFGWARKIEGSSYNYSDTWTQANGMDRKQAGAKCMDPTHPGTIDRMKYFINKFKNLGFKYIKLDFMTNGAVEADYFHDRYTTTGTQAYNYGMQKLQEFCGEEMFLVLSIAPVFPANYTHARRISCDAWGEMWHTQYMMNSLSYGWWLDRVYVFNDADHLVMGDRSEGENRARMTSGAITGLYMLGDNLSTAGNFIGTQISQEKVKKFATNNYINDIARIGKSFRPAYGHKQSSVSGAVDLFTYETNTHYYIAYFNYEGTSKIGELDLMSLGINAEQISTGRECWTKVQATLRDGKLRYSIPGNDVRVYMLEKNNTLNVSQLYSGAEMIVYKESVNNIVVKCREALDEISIISLDGCLILKKKVNDALVSRLQTENVRTGIYLVMATTTSGRRLLQKYIN